MASWQITAVLVVGVLLLVSQVWTTCEIRWLRQQYEKDALARRRGSRGL